MTGPESDSPARKLHPALTFVLIIGLTITTIGDELYLAVMLLQLESLGATGFVISTFLASQLLPAVFLAPFAGLLIDRFETSRVLITTQILQAAVLLAMSQTQDVTLLLVGAFVLGALFSISQPAIYALVPLIADNAKINTGKVNAIVEFFTRSAMLIGPITGGLLFEYFGAEVALLLDGASFGLAAMVVMIVGIRRPPEKTGVVKKPLEGVMAGFRIILEERSLRITLIIVALGLLMTSMVNVAFIFLVRNVLEASAAVFGLLYAMWGMGMLLGAVLAGRRELEKNLERPVLLGLGFMGIPLLITGLFPMLVVMLVMEFFGGVANGIHNVAYRTMLMLRTDRKLHGRVMAAYSAVGKVFIMLGFMLGSPFAASHPAAVYIASGTGTIIVGIIGILWLFRLGRLNGNS